MPLRPRGDDPPGSPRARGTPAPHTPRREDSPPPRHPLGRWPIPRTLSGRLIAGLVALLAIACASVGLVTYLAVQRSLGGELTNQLQTVTSIANNCMDSTLGRGPGDDGDSDDQAAPPRQGADDTSHGPSACGELFP
jgi:hypothetical protein